MRRSPTFRRGLAAFAALLLLAMAATFVLGAETSLLDGKLRVGDSVTVASGETVDGNLYVMAGTVQVDGTVDGDLTAFGGQVTVNGSVTGDLLVAGGQVSVNGDVEGDARTAGGTVTFNGGIAEDLLVSGGTVTLAGGGSVGGDVMASGGTLRLDGTIEGSVEGSAGTYTRTGTIGGTEHVRVTAGSGGADAPGEPTVGDRIGDALRHFAVLVILGALILWLAPRILNGPARALREQPLLSLGSGLIGFIGFIVLIVVGLLVAVLVAVVLGLIQLGTLAALEIVAAVIALFASTFLFWVVVGFLADIVVALTLARVLAPGEQRPGGWQELALLALGVAVVVLVTSLPVVGGIAKLAVVLFGLGAIVVSLWRRFRGPRPTATPPATAAA